MDEVFLTSGSVSAQVPTPAVGFAVGTPLAADCRSGHGIRRGGEGIRCYRYAGPSRASFAADATGPGTAGRADRIGGRGADTATVSVPGIAAEVLPVAMVARGSGGRYLGRMTAQGKSVEFHSQAEFDAFRVGALRQLGESPGQFARKWPGLVAATKPSGIAEKRRPKSITSPRQELSPRIPLPRPGTAGPGSSAGNHRLAPGAAAEDQTVEVEENGKKVSITDSKNSGITVTITESVNGKKKTTKVRAADTAELANKNPEAHKLYRKYFHPRPKNGKPK